MGARARLPDGQVAILNKSIAAYGFAAQVITIGHELPLRRPGRNSRERSSSKAQDNSAFGCARRQPHARSRTDWLAGTHCVNFA